ncbi:hypothetical protein SAMN02800692_1836 [Luteibacter sp. UNC138MFCol5.1]|uniref:hypothetical protein n=1 Tax=Luteibacter sp. UNC138MFCol5.1 TaxID=1502774 RepID=UPI0008CFA555|nr:hypothetical protein [Luteibacter sp. UNC138MFCol5.1]SEO74153.1 hypothetical protein SAMN02800692_1836 [Luteibacter sp. UNC138MFCol5.1]
MNGKGSAKALSSTYAWIDQARISETEPHFGIIDTEYPDFDFSIELGDDHGLKVRDTLYLWIRHVGGAPVEVYRRTLTFEDLDEVKFQLPASSLGTLHPTGVFEAQVLYIETSGSSEQTWSSVSVFQCTYL